MEALALTYRDETLRLFPLGHGPLEVGSGAGADIVVHDPSVAERHYLLVRDGASLYAHDVRASGEREPTRQLLPGRSLPLGKHHALVRVADAPTQNVVPSVRTEPLPMLDASLDDVVLLVGTGPCARCATLGQAPLTVGSRRGADLVLSDRAVSARHCRFELTPRGLFVRDLSSRNGTFVDGVRTMMARIAPGSRLRVGRTELSLLARGKKGDARGSQFVAASSSMLRVLEQVERMAHQQWPALVLGDSGVGKEGIARALHTRGPRANGPFVPINAGGLARDLVESELFGHEKGAFTGAASVHRGVFEQASGGTLFLDEIGELSLELQARLLRVIETGEVRRVGSEGAHPVDVRLVCATHRDLRQRAREGVFRLDLYYRIAQLVIEVPSLAERPDDVRALALHFLEEACLDLGPRSLSRAAHDVLTAHGWPGNVRELRSVIRGAALESSSEIVDADDVLRVIERLSGVSLPGSPQGNVGAVVERHRGNLSAAARALGVPRSTLRDRMQRKSEPPPRKDD
jgi:DNA-binding NtrC family response regulator